MSLCKSGPESGPELDPGGPAWPPGPAWEAAHWVCQGLPPAPLASLQEGPTALCLTTSWALPHACLDNFFTPRLHKLSLRYGCLCCLSQGMLGLGGVAAQAWSVRRQTVLKQWLSGPGRPVYPRQGPGRGGSFLPMPLVCPATQHTDSALPFWIFSFHKYLWSAYCVPSTVLHDEDAASQPGTLLQWNLNCSGGDK